MPPMEFEHTISVLERAKKVRALDHAATTIDLIYVWREVFVIFERKVLKTKLDVAKYLYKNERRIRCNYDCWSCREGLDIITYKIG
jgi:hypothetical protein